MAHLVCDDAHAAAQLYPRRKALRARVLCDCRHIADDAAVLFVALVERIAGWSERARQRATLAELDDRMLHDIGTTRSDAKFEVEKPFWR